MRPPAILSSLTPVVEALESLGVPYHIGGSLASSAHGIARASLDVDLVAELGPEAAGPLVERLSSAYYLDEQSVREAAGSSGSFNLIHLDTMVKIDVFVPLPRAFDREAQRRARAERLEDVPGSRTFLLKSPEDIILTKLEWFAQGGETSSRQWADVLGVLRVQAPVLDLGYLRRWADDLGVVSLLERALDEAARR